jgi:GR25 family glycosyltransferase involved in LPS biosynthesis
MTHLLLPFSNGQVQLKNLDAEAQDKTRWSLLSQLNGLRKTIYANQDSSDPLAPWRAELLHVSIDDVGASKAHLFQARSPTDPKILFTITTCKRLSLFMRTMHSFLRHCLDCWKISEWIALDDGSSDEDIQSMKRTFPFLNVLTKKELSLSKGHASSLNQLWWKFGLEKGYDYIFQMEDDWQFFRSDHYITRCLNALTTDHPRDQILINRLYSETAYCLTSVGGHWHARDQVWEHDHKSPEPRAEAIFRSKSNNGIHGSHTYWPGFSLRPGLIRTKSLVGYDPFTTTGRHFELEFANRWRGHTAFLPEISCWHIGRLTSERNDDVHPLNAYELNGMDQFGGLEQRTESISDPVHAETSKTSTTESEDPSHNTLPHGTADVTPPSVVLSNTLPAPANSLASQLTHREMHTLFYKMGADRINLDQYLPPQAEMTFPKEFEVWCVNLDRRTDRLERFTQRNAHPLRNLHVSRLPATDGQSEQPNHHWDRLGAYGNFMHHRGIMACGLSHMRIWERLIRNKDVEWMIVLEDDATLAPDFQERLTQQIIPLLTMYHSDWHIVWLGFHPSEHHWLFGADYGKPERNSSTLVGCVQSSLDDVLPTGDIVLQKWDTRIMSRQSMGGTHGYMIHKRGALELLQIIENNGMRHGIDWEMWRCTNMYTCIPSLVHAPSPAVHTLRSEFSDTDIPIVDMTPAVSIFGEALESNVSARERLHLYRLLNMRKDGLDGEPTLVHVSLSKWHIRHPSLLLEWTSNESWFWWAHDLVWFQCKEESESESESNQNCASLEESDWTTVISSVMLEEFGSTVNYLYLSNRSVLLILSPDQFDEKRVKEYFCLGERQVDREWIQSK